jgi:BirA family biotin operon repressor/biotin-[acetyl-CoA-carboxylase] ligase
LHPKGVKANQQFLISEIIALALAETIAKRVGEGVSIKWPNDIYWHDRKLCGILIEHRLSGNTIAESIIGVGLNVNQSVFVSNAPNPVSLKQITGLETDRMELLEEVMAQVVQGAQGVQGVHQRFLEWLYRREGFHRYSDKDGEFEASLSTVRPDGTLVLTDRTGRQREYAFKEVQYII